MWYVVGLLLLLALGQAFFYAVQSGDTLSYSDFRKAIRDGQVAELTLGDDRIHGDPQESERQAAELQRPSVSTIPSSSRISRHTA